MQTESGSGISTLCRARPGQPGNRQGLLVAICVINRYEWFVRRQLAPMVGDEPWRFKGVGGNWAEVGDCNHRWH